MLPRQMGNARNLVITAIIIAAVVLGAVLIAQNRQKASSGPQQAAPTIQPEQQTTSATITVELSAQNNSGEAGTATLTALEDGKTKVVLKLTGAPKDIAQPSHIHLGSCSKLGDVLYPLTSLQNGEAETILNAALKEGILDKLPLAVNVHKSGPEIAIYSACGDIMASSSPTQTITPVMTQAPAREGGPFQTPDDRRRGADKPE